jgi:hypothetical protein
MLAAIGTIATQQASAMKHTMKAVVQLLNYCATHPEAVMQYYASDMVLHIKSDAFYLSAAKARSRAARYHFLSDRPSDPTDPTAAPLMANGAVKAFAPSCVKSWQAPWRLNWLHYSTMEEKHARCAPP